MVIIIAAPLHNQDPKNIQILYLHQEIGINIFRLIMKFQTLKKHNLAWPLINIINKKTQMKTTNTTLITNNSQIKALTVTIRDHKMALIVINLTMIAIFTHSRNI